MKTTLLALAAAAAFGSFGAQAQEQPRSRADVIAELDAARAAGELGAWSGEDGGSFRMSSRQAGGEGAGTSYAFKGGAVEPNPMLGEDSGSFALSRAGYAEPRTLVATATGDEGE